MKDDRARLNPYVLCCEDPEWDLIGLIEAARRGLRRNSDDAHRKRAAGVRPAQDLGKRLLVGERAPLDEDHLGSNTLPAGEPRDIPQETSGASEEIAAVLLVPEGRDKTQVGAADPGTPIADLA